MTTQYTFKEELTKLPLGKGTSWYGDVWSLFKKRPFQILVLVNLFSLLTGVLSIIPIIGPILLFLGMNIAYMLSLDLIDTVERGFKQSS